MQDLIGFSWTELQRQWRRVLPGVIGVAAGVAILLTVLAGSTWLGAVTGQGILSQRALSQMTVTPGSEPTFTNAQVQWMLSLPKVDGGYPIVMGAFPAAIGDDGSVFQMLNLPAAVDRPALAAGSWPGENQVVLPDSGLMSRKTGSTIDSRALVGTTVTLTIPIAQGIQGSKTHVVTVAGVYHVDASPDSFGMPAVYSTLSTLEGILTEQGVWAGTAEPNGSAGFGQFVIDAAKPADVAGIAQQLEGKGLRPQFVEQSVHGLSSRIGQIQAAGGVLVVLIVLFASLSISNVLVQAVRQRRKEIAVLLAVGFTPRWIGASLMAEAALAWVASLVIGLLAAEAVAFAVFLLQPTVGLRIDAISVLLVGIGALVFCLGAAWIPSRHAMRVDPVEVLREA